MDLNREPLLLKRNVTIEVTFASEINRHTHTLRHRHIDRHIYAIWKGAVGKYLSGMDTCSLRNTVLCFMAPECPLHSSVFQAKDILKKVKMKHDMPEYVSSVRRKTKPLSTV